MPEHLQYEDEDIFNPETQHESSDVNVRALIWFFVIFVIFSIVMHFALWALYKGFVNMERKEKPRLTSIAQPVDAAVPKNQPLLQPFPRKIEGKVIQPQRSTPVTDLADMRREEEKALTTYGWVDQQKGVVRIPIDVAKQLVVQRGMQVQQGMPAAGTSAPATSSAGEGAGATQSPTTPVSEKRP